MNFKVFLYKISIVPLLLLSSCYSFSGGASSIGPEVKTIQINQAVDNSSFPGTKLVPTFMRELQNIFRNRTNLTILPNDGDIVLEEEFLSYNQTPLNIQGNKAQKTRLTIKIRVRYSNKKEPKQNFEQEFEVQQEYPANETLFSGTVQNKLVSIIVEQLVNNIFNKVANNW